MAITNGYATLQELQLKLGRPYDEEEPKASFLEDCITRASRFIDEYTSRIYYTKTLTNEKLDVYAWSDNGLYINYAYGRICFPSPIISITTIVEDSTTLTADDDYYVYDWYIDKPNGWSLNRKALSITGSMGYATTPGYVKEWCLTIAQAISGLGIVSVTDENGDPQEFLRNAIPEWLFKAMDKERRRFIV